MARHLIKPPVLFARLSLYRSLHIPLHPTREGKRLLLATFLIAVAAANTGNNLIYLILSLLCSIIVLSVVMLTINTRGLSVTLAVNGQPHAGDHADLTATVHNAKRRVPAYSIRLLLPDEIKGDVLVPYVPPQGKASETVSVVFNRRGRHTFEDVRVRCGFPFIFLERTMRVGVAGDALVYPRLAEVRDMHAERQNSGDMPAPKPGHGDDLLALREFRNGDDMKRIHWKATAKAKAKADALVVMEFAEELPRRATVVLDNASPSDPPAFESAVSIAASAALRLLEQGYYVRLLACSDAVPFGTGPGHRLHLLDTLAEIGESPMEQCVMDEPGGGGFTVLVLKGASSPLAHLAAEADRVIYA